MAIRRLAIGRNLPARAGVAGLLATASLLTACTQGGLDGDGAQGLLAGSPSTHQAQPGDEMGNALAYWGKAYAKNPRDKKAALAYARNLNAAGHKAQALSVIRHASTFHGNDREIASEYGRLALAAGQVQLAQKLLTIADDPSNPDWRIVSGRGTVLAQQGKYKEAIPYFERALALAPSNSTVLSNLAMAHAGTGELKQAESLLRRAVIMPNANPMVRKNLSVVLNLLGRTEEATRVAAGGEPGMRSTVGAPTATPVAGHNRTIAQR